MRKLIPMLILAVVSNSAVAEWVMIGTDDVRADTYANPTTMRRSGSRVKIWELLNFKFPKKGSGSMSVLSMKVRTEFDCKREHGRAISIASFHENMGHGALIYSANQIQEWRPVSPDSGGESLFKMACGKK